VQILVVVANVQARILKTVVEKGFALTAIVRKIVGPKRNGNTIFFMRKAVFLLVLSGIGNLTISPSILERESG